MEMILRPEPRLIYSYNALNRQFTELTNSLCVRNHPMYLPSLYEQTMDDLERIEKEFGERYSLDERSGFLRIMNSIKVFNLWQLVSLIDAHHGDVQDYIMDENPMHRPSIIQVSPFERTSIKCYLGRLCSEELVAHLYSNIAVTTMPPFFAEATHEMRITTC